MRVAITGGARGIGRSTADAFRRAGALVAIGDIDCGLAEQTASRLAGLGGPPVAGLPLDVINFTDSLDLELTGTGVRATAVLPGIVNTELSSGANYPTWLSGILAVEPEAVAVAIVKVVAREKAGTVSVPPIAGGLIKTVELLPRRFRIKLERRLGLDTAFAHADPAARAAYHQRIGIAG